MLSIEVLLFKRPKIVSAPQIVGISLRSVQAGENLRALAAFGRSSRIEKLCGVSSGRRLQTGRDRRKDARRCCAGVFARIWAEKVACRRAWGLLIRILAHEDKKVQGLLTMEHKITTFEYAEVMNDQSAPLRCKDWLVR